ncbi:MAG: helix-turn-helix domain-containing protein [Candidatus Omnitrophota bacterium]
MPTQGKIMTSKELAAYLRLHPFTVLRYAREGKIPAFKIGMDWRFHRKYIDRWLREKSSLSLVKRDRRKSTLDKA